MMKWRPMHCGGRANWAEPAFLPETATNETSLIAQKSLSCCRIVEGVNQCRTNDPNCRHCKRNIFVLAACVRHILEQQPRGSLSSGLIVPLVFEFAQRYPPRPKEPKRGWRSRTAIPIEEIVATSRRKTVCRIGMKLFWLLATSLPAMPHTVAM